MKSERKSIKLGLKVRSTEFYKKDRMKREKAKYEIACFNILTVLNSYTLVLCCPKN